MLPTFEEIFATRVERAASSLEIGCSREGRLVEAWRFGEGDLRVSLIGGCHADEPVGPLLLRHLVAYFSANASAPELTEAEWWIVPHVNPDGEVRNAAWCRDLGDAVDPIAYLEHAIREAPGDDVEFGFPRTPEDHEARPENRAVADWWRTGAGAFSLHASLHGMALAHGPWFLIEAAWAERSDPLQARCREAVAALGYALHDVDRKGDKGFLRIGPGFTTRPDSRAMAQFFEERGDATTAAQFRPSSMETIRSLGGDPLTLVSEMPIFLIPRSPRPGPSTGEDLLDWKNRMQDWRRRLVAGEREAVRRDLERAGVRPMPIEDQMRLQWTMIGAGVEQVRESRRLD